MAADDAAAKAAADAKDADAKAAADKAAADAKAKDGTPSGRVSIASNVKLDKTIPGGHYINAQGQHVNAHGQRIDEKGTVIDGTVTPVQEPPR